MAVGQNTPRSLTNALVSWARSFQKITETMCENVFLLTYVCCVCFVHLYSYCKRCSVVPDHSCFEEIRGPEFRDEIFTVASDFVSEVPATKGRRSSRKHRGLVHSVHCCTAPQKRQACIEQNTLSCRFLLQNARTIACSRKDRRGVLLPAIREFRKISGPNLDPKEQGPYKKDPRQKGSDPKTIYSISYTMLNGYFILCYTIYYTMLYSIILCVLYYTILYYTIHYIYML